MHKLKNQIYVAEKEADMQVKCILKRETKLSRTKAFEKNIDFCKQRGIRMYNFENQKIIIFLGLQPKRVIKILLSIDHCSNTRNSCRVRTNTEQITAYTGSFMPNIKQFVAQVTG